MLHWFLRIQPPNQALHHDPDRILFSRDTTPLQRPRRVNCYVRRRSDSSNNRNAVGSGKLPTHGVAISAFAPPHRQSSVAIVVAPSPAWPVCTVFGCLPSGSAMTRYDSVPALTFISFLLSAKCGHGSPVSRPAGALEREFLDNLRVARSLFMHGGVDAGGADNSIRRR